MLARMFSNTAMTVEKLAKVMNRKNSAPQMRAARHVDEDVGQRHENQLTGPRPAHTPKEKQAGKMISARA